MDALKSVKEYWDSHHLGTQFLKNEIGEVGSKEYFLRFDEAMERWSYKNALIDWISKEYPRGTLLEVGCGLGHDLVQFAQKELSVTAIDLAPSVARMARKHLRTYQLNGEVLQGNSEGLCFRNEKFDVVYSCGVLQHTPDMKTAVNEIYRVLRKDGLAVVVVYYRYSWFNVLSNVAKVNIEFEDEDPPIINRYSKRDLLRMFSQFSAVDVSLEYCYPSPTPRRGMLPSLYNGIFIPIIRSVPYSVMKHFGWHAVVKARK